MLNEKQFKNNIQELIDDFKVNYQQYKKESEASVETKLVEPLFKLLGWTEKDFRKQEKAERDGRIGHADYAFYIGDKKVFFLEVKRVGIPLEKEADKQVISYALSKRVPFAVSTNFEELKIFCVEQENAINNVFRAIKQPEDYVSNFQDVFFLSKESFEQGLILKKAQDENRLRKRVSIDKPLLDDLMYIRSLIARDIEGRYPGKYQINEKDEIIQRIIDRLIFIRRCEDTGINPENLILKEAQELPDGRSYSKLKEIFSKYNDVYNSGLFAIAKDNDCDRITIDGTIIKKLSQYLYESKDGKYIYNFDWIDADVLGQVYEQYLGKLLAQTKSGKAKLTNGQAHRKEQGIYYTPTYIVDYIVKNTVGELLKNKKIKVKDLKILDPACGSGSFLIKAFDYLYNNLSSGKDSKQYRIDSQGKYSIKTEILKNNLYGVDLDNKAVEITKLNLLLKAAEKNRRLPEEIDTHVRHGNSLIDDENIARLDAFKWEEKFKELMKKGGFDVIIGNPPWGAKIEDAEKEYFMHHYKSTKREIESHLLFIELSLKLVDDGGFIGLIVPNTWLYLFSTEPLRDMILTNCEIASIVELTKYIFAEAPDIVPVIIILRKSKSGEKKKRIIKTISFSDRTSIDPNEFINLAYKKVNQRDVAENYSKIFNLNLTPEVKVLLDKIRFNSKELAELESIRINYGIKTGDNEKFIATSKISNNFKKCLKTKEITKYRIQWKNLWLDYQPQLAGYRKDSLEVQKIIVQYIRKLSLKQRLICGFDEKGEFYPLNNYSYITGDEDLLKSILGILNSKLMNFYFANTFIDYNIKPTYLSKLPINMNLIEKNREKIIGLVSKTLSLNKRLNELGNKKTSESARIDEEIKKTDNEIDQLVYKLYGLTKEEIAIVEENLKS